MKTVLKAVLTIVLAALFVAAIAIPGVVVVDARRDYVPGHFLNALWVITYPEVFET